MPEAKQVIVMRRDLGMRKGKMVAQGAHASLGCVLTIQNFGPHDGWQKRLTAWLNGSFTKICVSVDSEQELIDIYDKAVLASLPVKLITDAGHTEFHGVPTRTCLAIGPAWVDEVDTITGNLKLL